MGIGRTLKLWLQRFGDVKQGSTLKKADVKELIEFLKKSKLLLEHFGFRVTATILDDLLAFWKDVRDRKEGTVLTDADTKRVRKIRGELESVAQAEGKTVNIFVMENRHVDSSRLLGSAKGLIKKNVHEAISEGAIYDIQEAAKCLAFDRWTAAAFHILRATEGVLRQYYKGIVRRKRITDLTMGGILRDFKKHSKKPDERILTHLQNIKDNYRNPTNHPELRYDMESAEAVFELCLNSIGLMVRDNLWKQS